MIKSKKMAKVSQRHDSRQSMCEVFIITLKRLCVF